MIAGIIQGYGGITNTGSLQNNGLITDVDSNNPGLPAMNLQVVGAATFLGGNGGVLNMGQAGASINGNDGMFYNGTGHTIQGQRSIHGSSQLFNNGTIDANLNGQILAVSNDPAFTNNGLLEATNGGELDLGSTVSPGMSITGTGSLLTDASSTIKITDATVNLGNGVSLPIVVYNSGTILVNSGTVSINSNVDNTGSILFHDGTFTVSSPCTFTNDNYFGSDPSTLEFGNLVLDSGSTTSFSAGDTVTIDGNLTDSTVGGLTTTGSNILFTGGNAHTLTTNNTLSVANLTVGVDDTVTVSGTGGITTTATLLNKGVINASTPSQTFAFTSQTTFTNQGTIEATAANTILQLNGPSIDNSSNTIGAVGGAVIDVGNLILGNGVVASIDNAGGTIGALEGSTINVGNVVFPGGALMSIDNESGTISAAGGSVVNLGHILFPSSASISIDNTGGTISATGADVVGLGNVLITGGEVLNSGALEALEGGQMNLTGVTASGTGAFVTDATSEIDLNNCIISAGGGFRGASGLQNDGTVGLTGSHLTISSNVINSGVINLSGSTFTVPVSYTCTQATGASFHSDSSILEFGNLVLQSGSTTSFSASDQVTIDGDLTDNSANAYLDDQTYGDLMPGVAPTPEPAGLGVAAMATLMLLRRRRARQPAVHRGPPPATASAN